MAPRRSVRPLLLRWRPRVRRAAVRRAAAARQEALRTQVEGEGEGRGVARRARV